jgi:hypothetical protein
VFPVAADCGAVKLLTLSVTSLTASPAGCRAVVASDSFSFVVAFVVVDVEEDERKAWSISWGTSGSGLNSESANLLLSVVVRKSWGQYYKSYFLPIFWTTFGEKMKL